MLDTLLNEIDGYVGELCYAQDVIETVDEWQDAGGGQVPLIGFVAIEVFNEDWCLVGSDGLCFLVLGDNAEGNGCPSF